MAGGQTHYRPKVVMPLYYYPLTEETWQPLHRSIVKHPDVTFVVVINPNSGPDSYPLPSKDYRRELPKLNRHPNVVTVGYVKIDYCKRPIGESISEINTYAGWGDRPDIPDMDMGGIYIDETPNHFSPERAEYLDVLRRHIKKHSGFTGDKLVIHNPGTPPDAGLAHPSNGPDIICTCEEPFELYRCDRVQQRLKEYHFEPARSLYQISAVPIDRMQHVVRELCQRGEYIFATNLVDDFYESFGPSWDAFVEAVANARTLSNPNSSQTQAQTQSEGHAQAPKAPAVNVAGFLTGIRSASPARSTEKGVGSQRRWFSKRFKLSAA